MRLLLAAALLPLASCGHADGSPGVAADGAGPSRSYNVQGFTGVALTGSDDVEVRTGGAFSVRAEGDPAALNRLKITLDGSTLRVGQRNGIFGSTNGAKVFVTMPGIVRGDVTGSGGLTIDRVTGDTFAGSATGSGDLVLHALAVRSLTVSLTGSGDVTAAGQARSLALSVAGSGDIDARALTASSADVQVFGSGNVRAAVDGAATVKTTGSGDVDLGPRAKCSVTKTGSGEVTCGG